MKLTRQLTDLSRSPHYQAPDPLALGQPRAATRSLVGLIHLNRVLPTAQEELRGHNPPSG